MSFGIKEFLALFIGHEVLEGVLKNFTKGASKVSAEVAMTGLKNKLFGFGDNDEILSFAACQIAVDDLDVSKENVIKVVKIFAGLTAGQRNKVTNIIGADEQTLSTKVTTERKKEDKKDKKEKGKEKGDGPKIETTEKKVANIRGANMIKLLSEMSDEEIKTMLKGLGALDTMESRLNELVKSLKSVVITTIGKKNLKQLSVDLQNTADDQELKFRERMTRKKKTKKPKFSGRKKLLGIL